MNGPQFKHDCELCTHVGSDAEHDYYYCEQNFHIPTVIARYGNDGPDYTSGLELADHDPRLATARRLAVEKGVLQ